MGTKTRQAIARSVNYNKMIKQPAPDCWSAKKSAYSGTSIEAGKAHRPIEPMSCNAVIRDL